MTGKLNGQDSTERHGVLIDVTLDFGSLFRRLGSFVDLLNRLTEASEKHVEGHGEFRVRGLGDQVRGVYGFSIRNGVGGVPRVEPFGNLYARDDRLVVDGVHEPLVDVFEEGDEVVVTVELPGVLENDILIRTDGERLVVKTIGRRRYAKEVRLPAPVVDGSFRKTCHNGVLEIRARKKTVS